jgi:hypothetical protein
MTAVPPNQGMHVALFHSTNPLDINVRTVYRDKGLGAPVAGDLWLEVKGRADSLKVAIQEFASLCYRIADIIAISANAAVGELEIEVAYDSTPGLSRR